MGEQCSERNLYFRKSPWHTEPRGIRAIATLNDAPKPPQTASASPCMFANKSHARLKGTRKNARSPNCTGMFIPNLGPRFRRMADRIYYIRDRSI